MMDDKALEEMAFEFCEKSGCLHRASLTTLLREVAAEEAWGQHAVCSRALADAEAEVARLKVEYAAAIERGMLATAELQRKLVEVTANRADLHARWLDEQESRKRAKAEVERSHDAILALTGELERLKVELVQIEGAIPETFYAGVETFHGVEQLVRIWQNAVKSNTEAEEMLREEHDARMEALAQRDEARATKDMHKERQEEAWAEMERLKLKRREQFNRWGVEIRYHDQEQMALRLERAEAEVERLQGDIAALKNVLRGDESQMKQWQSRNLEMRNDLDRTVLARDEARAEVERMRAAVEAWRKAESAVECEACAVFGASLPEGEKP